MFDVLIFGVGAAGLAAALTLVQVEQKVKVLEARERVGGRILSLADPSFSIPLDLEAEFIHGHEAAASPFLRAADTLFFAGEATHETAAGTVHGALESGVRAAQEILAL